jgi:hypothetical protein
MAQTISGHVFRYERKRRPVWRAKYRLPNGRQVKKTLGPAWTARGRPPAGYFTKRTAEAWLRRVLADAAVGTLAAWCAPVPPSRTRATNTCATSSRTPAQAVDAARLRLDVPQPRPAGAGRDRAPGRTRRAALARRRLPWLGDPHSCQLHERPRHVAEVRQGPLGADGAAGCRGACAARPARPVHRRGRPGLRGHRRRLPRWLGPVQALRAAVRSFSIARWAVGGR